MYLLISKSSVAFAAKFNMQRKRNILSVLINSCVLNFFKKGDN